MGLFLHLLLHVTASLGVGLYVHKKYKKPNFAYIAALLGGFLIDLDHLIDYFFAFGFDFKLNYFLRGYEFLKSDKIYILFHAWEYVVILFFLWFCVKKRKKLAAFLLALALGIASHLIIDTLLNHTLPQAYFISYRIKHGFDLPQLVPSDHFQRHLQLKKKVKF